MADITIFNPEKLAKPLGPLSHIARVKAAELVFIAGQVAVDGAGFTSWREREFPKMSPDGAYRPNTLLIVDGLAQEAFLIEVQAIAAL